MCIDWTYLMRLCGPLNSSPPSCSQWRRLRSSRLVAFRHNSRAERHIRKDVKGNTQTQRTHERRKHYVTQTGTQYQGASNPEAAKPGGAAQGDFTLSKHTNTVYVKRGVTLELEAREARTPAHISEKNLEPNQLEKRRSTGIKRRPGWKYLYRSVLLRTHARFMRDV